MTKYYDGIRFGGFYLAVEDNRLYWVRSVDGVYHSEAYQTFEFYRAASYVTQVFPEWAKKEEVKEVNGVERIRQALNGERGEDQKKIAEAGIAIVDLLLRKNHDYGGSAWKRPMLVPSLEPRTAMLCRMSDKLERIQTLMDKGNEVVDEKISDTFKDLCGYLMLYVAFDGEK